MSIAYINVIILYYYYCYLNRLLFSKIDQVIFTDEDKRQTINFTNQK